MYWIPNWRRPVYAGLYGLLPAVRDAQFDNNLGHPFCDNVRGGDWLLDYINFRLSKLDGANTFKSRVKEITEAIKGTPRYMVPYQVTRFLEGLSNGI